ncbi:MAG: hypothetical protein IPK32_09305 [Verrucomicrobiaceae bacterium]|nr:hypothetical protein [Verrucomicrobiaceae bacterium]
MKSPFFATAFTLFGQTVSTQPRRFTLLSSALSFCMAMLPSLAVGQTVSTWAGGTGDWLNAGAWTPGGVPGDALADVVIDNAPATASTVTFGRNDSVVTDLTIGRLRIDSGDTLQFGAAPNTLEFGPAIAFSGAGSLILNGTMSLPWSSNALRGAKSIAGSGQLLLGSQGQRPEIYDALTNSATIKGSALFGRANAAKVQVTNSGLIEANLSGQDIDFHGLDGANRSVNTGTLKASGGGQMQIGMGEWLNTGGTVLADGLAYGTSSQVAFYRGGLMEGGTISAANGGGLQVGGSFNGSNGGYQFRNVTQNGPMNLLDQMLLQGTYTNNGTITIPEGFGRIDGIVTGSYDPAQTITLAGTGQVVLDRGLGSSGFGYRRSIWHIQDQLIRGRGRVGDDDFEPPYITNRGTFQADQNEQELLLRLAGIDNQNGGVLRAQTGGTLRIHINSNGVVKNTGGTIEATTGGRVRANFGRIEGGLVRNNGGFIDLHGMTLVNPGTGMTLEGELTLGSPNVYNEARLVGAIENKGMLQIEGGTQAARLWISEDANRSVTLTGGGTIQLGNPNQTNRPGEIWDGLDGSNSARTLINTDNTLAGYGRIGNTQTDPRLILQNSALVRANASGKTLSLGLLSATNSGGTFCASVGGLMSISASNGFNNTGGVIEAISGGGVSFAASTSVTNGTLKNNAGTFNLSNATLINGGAGLTLQGTHPFTVDHSQQAEFRGAIQNESSVRLLNTGGTRTLLMIGASAVSLTGGGELYLENDSMVNASSSATLSLDEQDLHGAGWVGAENGYTRHLTVINNTSVEADQAGKQLRFTTASLTNSPGKTMKAINGGTLALWSSNLINTNASILATNGSTVEFGSDGPISGGLVNSEVGGTIKVAREMTAKGGVIFTNAGTLEFGTLGGTGFNGLADGGSSIISSGTINKVGGSDYSIFSPLNNTGAIQVQNGTLRWMAGGDLSNSTFSASANANLTFQDTPFTFSGVNTFTGSGNHWFGNSTVTLADAATALNVSGNFNIGNYGTSTLTGPGTMNVNAGGTLTIHPGTSHFSGPKLVTLAGSNTTINKSGHPLEFTNGATWENSGMVSMGGYINVLNGAVGTLFKNLSGGVFQTTAAQENRLAVPYENSGTIEAFTGSLSITSTGTFNNGSTKAAAGFGIYASGGTVNFVGGANASTGEGFFGPWNGSFNFASGAKLTGENIGFYGTSSVSGAGTLEVTKNLQIGSTHDLTINNSLLRIAPTATATYNLPLSNGFCRLMNGAVFENAGQFDHYLVKSFTGDDTGLFRTLEGSITNFNAVVPNFGYFADVSVDVPVEFAGIVAANQGKLITFTQGGLLKATAKLWSNHSNSVITFTGAAPLRVQGRTNEFSGSGIVRFSNTRLSFEDPSADPADDPLIAAGATVTFVDATNIVEGNGLLTGTQFTFAGASTTINQATLQNSQGWNTGWIASGGSLNLQNGARFLNEGTFNITTHIGAWTGTAGTLFHNKSTGRLVHDTSTNTVIALPFQNDGILEVRAGTLNFSGSYTGTGGVAASNGAKLTLPLGSTALGLLPGSLQVLGAGSEINVTFPSGDKLTALEANGGRLVAAGGGNMVAAGGGNILSHNGGVLVAAGGMNLLATGGGNITSEGANSRIEGSGSLVAAAGGNVLSHNGGTIVAAGGLNADGPGNVIATGAGSLMQASSIVAAGGMNIVAAGGGNIVAAGGLNGSGGEALQARMASFGEEPSSGPGTITVDTGSRLAGDGTFEGQGQVMNGSSVNPGFEALGGSNQVGAMQWNGSLEIAAGASLNLQLGGTTPGTQHDRLNVSQAFIMNGTLVVTFVNGFGASINSTHTFDVAVATSGITSNLTGTRIPVASAYGTFLVTLVNGGTTLRLSDYQLAAPTFSHWATIHGLSGPDADLLADPFHTGTSNLLKYALGLSPQFNGSPIISGTWQDLSGQQFLTLSYTRPQAGALPSDILYEPQLSSSLAPGDWQSGPAHIQPVGSPVPGPGDLETITVRSMHPIGPASPSEFLRLRVEQVPLAP